MFYYTFADTYISSVRTALDAQLDSLGVTYNNFDGNNNQTTQNEQIQTAVTDGYNLLVVNMVTSGSPDVANEIISLANGTPVIFFNRAIEADGEEGTVLNANANICFIGTDAPEAGHLQGKMVGEYLLANWDAVDLNGDGKISYAMFKGDEANVEAIYRTQFGVEDADACPDRCRQARSGVLRRFQLREVSGRPRRRMVRTGCSGLHEHEPFPVQRGQRQHDRADHLQQRQHG